MHTVRLPDGETVPALGQGTWMIGEDRSQRSREISALRTGIDLGMTLRDTAEMYGDGQSEELIAEAIAGRRDSVFLVSKVYPHNASRNGVAEACARSLQRLGTDRIDLYLLHWRGGVPLEQTVAGFERLKADGKIRHWGVSNFDTDDMEDLMAAGGTACAVNQILYNIGRRGCEFDLLPWLGDHGIPIMAYSPVEQGRLPQKGAAGAALAGVAARHQATPYQIALAWLLRRPETIVIPKAADPAHVRDNRRAADIALDAADLAAIDAAFPPPRRKTPLAML